METDNSIASDLRRWIKENLLDDRPDVDLEDSTELLRTGLIDSLDILLLVEFIESEFNVEIPEDEILPAAFRTVETMTQLVSQQRAAR